jgi:hypothetical protein
MLEPILIDVICLSMREELQEMKMFAHSIEPENLWT